MMTVLLCAVAYLIIGTSVCIIEKQFVRLDEEERVYTIMLWPLLVILLITIAPVWLCLKVVNKVCGD